MGKFLKLGLFGFVLLCSDASWSVKKKKNLHYAYLLANLVLYAPGVKTGFCNVHPQVLKTLLALNKTELSVQIDGHDTLWGETGVCLCDYVDGEVKITRNYRSNRAISV